MGKAIDFTKLSVEEAQEALGITFTKAQRESFEENVRKASMDQARKTALEAIDRMVSTETDSEEVYTTLLEWSERFDSLVVKATDRNQGRGRISEKMLRVPTPHGDLIVRLTKTL